MKDYISRSEAIRLIDSYQGGAMDKPTARKILEGMCGVEICEDTISRQAAIDALWKALYEYEDKTEKQFQESEELDVADWMLHKIFVQNMSDIDRQVILDLPSAQPEIIRCKDCKHFHYDMPYVIQGIPVLGHEVCDFWGDGCKTDENGFCSYAERRSDGVDR